MARRHRHRHAAQESRCAQQRLHGIWPQAERLRTTNEEWRRAEGTPRLRRRPQHQRQGHDRRDGRGKTQHRRLPADPDQRVLKDRWPDHAGDVLPGRDQRQRGAATAVEPAADIDQHWRVERAAAEKADQNRMPEVERPDLAGRRDRQPERCHYRAEDYHPAHSDAIGDPPHQHAAAAGPDPDEGSGQRHH